MNLAKWNILKQCARGGTLQGTPVALIVDSPWIPGYLKISTLDYLTDPQVWLRANLEVERQFPEAIFVPGFWVETGMTAEPSGFGCRISFYPDRPPVAHAMFEDVEATEGLLVPDPRMDGFMPLILNQYRNLRPQILDAGHVLKIVAARGPLTVASHLLGVTNFLLGLKLNPTATHRLLTTTTTLVRTWLEAQAEAIVDAEGILVLDDMAGFLSPKDYQTFAHPYLKQVFDAFPGALRIFHNDTDNPVPYPDLRSLGVDIFNFTHLQPLEKVRKLVGPEICLMGNVPPLEVLAKGTPEEVRRSAHDCLASDSVPGRLLLSAGGGVSPGTPEANLRALLQTGSLSPQPS